ncbi:P-loop containing nucleoside triphosphate hydrolase protein [Colletotrichum cereale]|nr:P-loop containing nucleoside triphosphate hydrolase protein [Colletotrichum cereale]
MSSCPNSDIQTVQTRTSKEAGIFIATISFFVTAFVIGSIEYVFWVEECEKLPSSVTSTVELRGVTFAYPLRHDTNVPKNVSLMCTGGKYTAIIGLLESGKSTIAGLAVRVYDPKEGTFLIDGHDIRTLKVGNLRYISSAQQKPSLLDCSLLEQIALGLMNSPKEEDQGLREALYGPNLGRLAEELMHGAGLNPAAQAYWPDMIEIMAVENVSKGRNLITIAHRLSTIKNADNTTAMNDGDIVEQETHVDLITRNGAYANLANLQNIHAVEEDEAPSYTSTAVESSATSINIEKHGVDSTDLAQAIEADPGKKESEKPEKAKKSKGNKQKPAAQEL